MGSHHVRYSFSHCFETSTTANCTFIPFSQMISKSEISRSTFICSLGTSGLWSCYKHQIESPRIPSRFPNNLPIDSFGENVI